MTQHPFFFIVISIACAVGLVWAINHGRSTLVKKVKQDNQKTEIVLAKDDTPKQITSNETSTSGSIDPVDTSTTKIETRIGTLLNQAESTLTHDSATGNADVTTTTESPSGALKQTATSNVTTQAPLPTAPIVPTKTIVAENGAIINTGIPLQPASTPVTPSTTEQTATTEDKKSNLWDFLLSFLNKPAPKVDEVSMNSLLNNQQNTTSNTTTGQQTSTNTTTTTPSTNSTTTATTTNPTTNTATTPITLVTDPIVQVQVSSATKETVPLLALCKQKYPYTIDVKIVPEDITTNTKLSFYCIQD